MKIEAKSLYFKAELEKRIKDFANKKAKATLVVGPEAYFWHYQEFGTATRRANVPEFGVTGPGQAYEIHPIPPNKFLRFPDFENKYPTLDHDKEGFVFTERIPASDEDIGVSHPGIHPTAFIRNVLPDIRDGIRELLRKSFLELGVSFEAFRQVVHIQALPLARDLIVRSLGIRVLGTSEYGRLGGDTAADVFKLSAEFRIDE